MSEEFDKKKQAPSLVERMGLRRKKYDNNLQNSGAQEKKSKSISISEIEKKLDNRINTGCTGITCLRMTKEISALRLYILSIQ